MDPVRDLRCRVGATQAQFAAIAGTSQPTIAAYESGSKSPTLRTLQRLARAVGREVAVLYVPPLTREDRLSLELHRAIADKLTADPASVVKVGRGNVARMSAANPGARPILREWRRALDGSVDELVEILVDPRQHARELRHVTPFAGVLAPAERWACIRNARQVDARR